MRKKSFFLIGLIATLALAQEGHPLVGTWHGDWGASGGQRNRVVLYMKWENKAIVGMINPGPNALPMKTATLDANNWTVRFEADTKENMHVVIEGKLDNIGSYNRTITGTWMQGGTKSDFKVTRD